MNLTGERKDIDVIGWLSVIIMVLLIIEVFNEK